MLDSQSVRNSTGLSSEVEDHSVDTVCPIARSQQLHPVLLAHAVDHRSKAIELVADCLCFLAAEAESFVADCEEPFLALPVRPGPLWGVIWLDGFGGFGVFGEAVEEGGLRGGVRRCGRGNVAI